MLGSNEGCQGMEGGDGCWVPVFNGVWGGNWGTGGVGEQWEWQGQKKALSWSSRGVLGSGEGSLVMLGGGECNGGGGGGGGVSWSTWARGLEVSRV